MNCLNLIIVMVILCAFQWNVVTAEKAKKVVVNFADDAGQLYLYNKGGNMNDISNCRFDLSNKRIICVAHYRKSVKLCDDSKDECIRTVIMYYDLIMPYTRIEGDSCVLTNGTTFKSSKLMAMNSNNKWVQAHSLANYKLIYKDEWYYLPETLNLSTAQKFDFITAKNCKFSAYYKQVKTVNTSMGEN